MPLTDLHVECQPATFCTLVLNLEMPRISMASLTFGSMKAKQVAGSSADDDLIWRCRGACCLGGKDGWIFAKLG